MSYTSLPFIRIIISDMHAAITKDGIQNSQACLKLFDALNDAINQNPTQYGKHIGLSKTMGSMDNHSKHRIFVYRCQDRNSLVITKPKQSPINTLDWPEVWIGDDVTDDRLMELAKLILHNTYGQLMD